MRSGRCPKCQSTDVYHNRGQLLKMGGYGFGHVPLGVLRSVEMDHYICAECGFVEQYAHLEEHLRRVRERWTRVRSEVGQDAEE